MTDQNKTLADMLHLYSRNLVQNDPVSLPLTTSSVYHLRGDVDPEQSHVKDHYGRFGGPVWRAVEAKLSLLEGAPSLLFPSGMAAIAAVFYALLKTGDKVLLPSDGYYTNRALAESYLAPMGIKFEVCETVNMCEVELSSFALILVETPSNPNLDVCDLRRLSQKARQAGAKLVVDNTTMSGLLQRPLDLGADIVLASDTKVAGGHADLLAGHVATRDAKLYEPMREWRKFSGSICGNFDAWLLHRGLETLELRLNRMCENAARLAPLLAAHPAVQFIRYPGHKDDPSYGIAKGQMEGFGFLIGLCLAGEAQAESFLQSCPYIAETTSFGSIHTSGERRARWGDDVAAGFIRLSIGCEPFAPLWDATESSLDDL